MTSKLLQQPLRIWNPIQPFTTILKPTSSYSWVLSVSNVHHVIDTKKRSSFFFLPTLSHRAKQRKSNSSKIKTFYLGLPKFGNSNNQAQHINFFYCSNETNKPKAIRTKQRRYTNRIFYQRVPGSNIRKFCLPNVLTNQIEPSLMNILFSFTPFFLTNQTEDQIQIE